MKIKIRKSCPNPKCSRKFRVQQYYDTHIRNYNIFSHCIDRRQIGTPITNAEYLEIEKYIKENKYTNISNFLRVAIKNQLKSGASS